MIYKAFDTKTELNKYIKECKGLEHPKVSKAKLIKFIKSNQGKYLYLAYADLSKVDFFEIDLSFAYCRFANFRKAKLFWTYLPYADCAYADFTGAYFETVCLYRTNFRNTNLEKAMLCMVGEGAIHNDKTIFPNGFNPKEFGMVKGNQLSI